MTRKVQLVRGVSKPQPHQVLTIHQTTKQERESRPARDSWWTAHASPQAPRTEDFYAEARRQALHQVNKAERQPRGAWTAPTKSARPPQPTHCLTCQKPLTADMQKKRLTRCRACRKEKPGIVARRKAEAA